MHNVSNINTQENPRTLTILAPKTNIPIDITFEYVTPAMAKLWLKDNIDNNRRPNMRYVQSYARSMAAGHWDYANGDSIRFNQDGKLVDGQHRLLAVIEYGSAVHMMTMWGVSKDAILTVDDGYSRKLNDCFLIHGVKTKGRLGSLTAAVRNLFVLKDCFTLDINFNHARVKTVPKIEIIRFFDQLTDFNDLAQTYGEKWTNKDIETTIPSAVCLAMHYLFHDIHPKTLDLMFTSFADKIPADGLGKKSPTWQVLRKIASNRENQTPIRVNDYINMFVWCMKEMVKGETSKMPLLGWQFTNDFEGRLIAKQKLQRIQ